MDFCDECANILLVQRKESRMISVCRICSKEFPCKDQIFFRNIKGKDHPYFYASIVNLYTPQDPIVPVLLNTNCPSCNFTSATFVQYKSSKIKYLYQCRSCATAWKMVKLDSGFSPMIVFAK